MSLYTNKKTVYCTISEMNEHLKYIKGTYQIIFDKKNKNDDFLLKAYIEDLMVYFKLTYKRGKEACTYVVRKDGSNDMQKIEPREAFRIMSKYYKVPRIDRRFCGRAAEGGLSASPFLWINPKYEKQWVDAIGYDMNRAYGYGLMQPMPDTSVPYHDGYIKEGEEIGFLEMENPKHPNTTMLVAIHKGYSPYVFPLMPSPFVNFVKTWDKKIRKAQNKEERSKAKNVIVFSVGYLQNINPFIRATVVTACNDYIKSLIDPETTLYCNTDSIVSLVPRDDLTLGENVGEWKVEHIGGFAYIGYDYQWRDGKTSVRGVPKEWIAEKQNWDIVKDTRPCEGNRVVFDKEKLKLKEVKGK